MKVLCWDKEQTEADGRLGELVTVTSPNFFYKQYAWVLMFENKKLEWFIPNNIRRCT